MNGFRTRDGKFQELDEDRPEKERLQPGEYSVNALEAMERFRREIMTKSKHSRPETITTTTTAHTKTNVSNTTTTTSTTTGIASAESEYHQPYIELLQKSVNAKAWYGPINLDGVKLHNITEPHCFGIELDDKDGNVYLYNKYLANSEFDTSVKHEYPCRESGNWTTRAVLIPKDTPINKDPQFLPKQHVDAPEIERTIDLYLDANAITESDSKELKKVLQGFREAESKQAADCKDCRRILNDIAAIGVIHRGADGDEVAREHAKEQNRQKNILRRLFTKHVQDEPHQGFNADRWFTKWVERVKQYIRPSYQEHNHLPTNTEPYHPHPSNLVSDKSESLLRKKDTRSGVGLDESETGRISLKLF